MQKAGYDLGPSFKSCCCRGAQVKAVALGDTKIRLVLEPAGQQTHAYICAETFGIIQRIEFTPSGSIRSRIE